MSDFFDIDIAGEQRIIGGCRLPDDPTPTTLATVFGDVANQTLIPRGQWKPVSLEAFLPPVYDQNGIGMCNAADSITCLEACRNMAGLEYVHLSAGDLYRRVSGGSDRGSLPEDALKELMTGGVTTEATTPFLEWRKNRGTAEERSRFRITEAYWCPTFEHAASAAQQGFMLNTNVWWYSQDNVDGDGWLRNVGGGRKGGHSIAGYSLEHRNGQWGIGIQNSWTTRWGIDGRGVLPEARCAEGCKVFSWWALRAAVQEDSGFPAPR